MQSALLWTAYFFCNVYGHVGLKLAVPGHSSLNLARSLFSPWGTSAIAAWAASALLWMALLHKNTMLVANTCNAFSYVLIVLTAYFAFKEPIGAKQLAGVLLVTAGIWLVTSK